MQTGSFPGRPAIEPTSAQDATDRPRRADRISGFRSASQWSTPSARRQCASVSEPIARPTGSISRGNRYARRSHCASQWLDWACVARLEEICNRFGNISVLSRRQIVVRLSPVIWVTCLAFRMVSGIPITPRQALFNNRTKDTIKILISKYHKEMCALFIV